MTLHIQSVTAVVAASLAASLLAAPALAQEAPEGTAAAPVKIDLPPVAVSPTGQRLPGKVIWFDLLTLDPARSRPFYEGVLGWTFEDRGSYAIARDAGVPVAGMLQVPAPKPGAPAPRSRWMPLISVPDVSAAAAAAQKAGGRILEGPGSLGARGRYAAVADPRGAQFVLVTAAGGDPLDADAPPPGWMWAELWTDDLKGAAAFYRAVVGYDAWQVGAGAQATWIFASGGRPRARAARMPFEKAPAQWLPYVVVKDLKAALGRVAGMNGRVLRQPAEKGPQLAVIADPGGATLVLEQRPEQPAEQVAGAPVAAGAAVAGVPAPPPPPPTDVTADLFGLDAAQQKSQEEAAAQASAAQPGQVVGLPGGDVGAEAIVVAPAPYANVWIAPPAWGSAWGPWWGMPYGWIGSPWWGMPPMWGPGYVPPYYPYYPRGGASPGYRPPPGYRPAPGPRPPTPGYRPPVPAPRPGGSVPSYRPTPAPSYRPAPAPSYHPAPAPAPRPAPPAPRR